jgi:hypothetical protein
MQINPWTDMLPVAFMPLNIRRMLPRHNRDADGSGAPGLLGLLCDVPLYFGQMSRASIMAMRNDTGWRIRTWSARLGMMVLAMFAAGCCSESKRQVTIAGTVRYDGFAAGSIDLLLAENESTRCGGGQTPGVQIASATLSGPGTFSLTGTVCWADSPPRLDLMGYARDGTTVPCKAGAYLGLDPASAANVELDLVEGNCPMRK